MLPSLYISHGSPMLALRPSPARDFLAGLGAQLQRPKAIVVASGHWETERPEVSAVAVNDTIHDFYGFPPALYAMRYPAPGSPDIAERIAALLRQSGLSVEIDHDRGLDHGAWVPLSLMYPGHEIPVLQLALQSRLGPPHHLQLGRAIAALREQDVLVIGSGSFTHNLGRPRAPDLDAPAPPDVIAFADWMHTALTERRVDDLLDYRRKAPYAALQHPTEEHLLPLFVALGAAGDGARDASARQRDMGHAAHGRLQLRRLMRLFLYGTLLDAGTLASRSGHPELASRLVSASLPGWQRVAVRGGRYPTLRRHRARVVSGALLDAPARVLARLAAYEGAAYRLKRVVVVSPNGKTSACTWIAPAGTRRPWQAKGS